MAQARGLLFAAMLIMTILWSNTVARRKPWQQHWVAGTIVSITATSDGGRALMRACLAVRLEAGCVRAKRKPDTVPPPSGCVCSDSSAYEHSPASNWLR